MKFKVGDKVKRINGNHGGMSIGDIGIIIEIENDGGLRIRKFDTEGTHDNSNFELVSSNYKPKNPTHLVVWEVEGCGDPCKFFTNEKEAREEIKKLSELSGVKKDSIILVEIKSAQKVNVIKNVRLNQYKI